MSFEATSFRVFRLTLDGGSTTTDSITFNDNAETDFKDTKKEGAYLLSLQRGDPEGIGNNQAAEKPDGNVQPLGIVEGTFILKGFITNMHGNANDGDNFFVSLLHKWKEEPQAIRDQLEAGRFGFVDEGDINNTLLPVGTGPNAVGLIFEDFSKINDYPRNRVEFTLTFRRSRGLDI